MTDAYLLYVVPESQPEASSQSRIYGGYHITIFPETKIDAPPDIRTLLKGFIPGARKAWRLPRASDVLVSEKGFVMISVPSKTLSQLADYFQSTGMPFERAMRWEPYHLTLGSIGMDHTDDPDKFYELLDLFKKENVWFLQLVHKHRDPVTNKMVYEWLPDQRVRLRS